jgi:hypothetical protein
MRRSRLTLVASVALALAPAGCELVAGTGDPRVVVLDAAPPDAGPPRLEILLEGNDPSLQVTSEPPGIVCPSDCTLDTIAAPGKYTLMASTDVSAKFQGWRGVAGCGASPTCDVMVTQAIRLHARSFARSRLAFVTSETFQPGLLGGRSEADAACNRLAQRADLPHVGDYVAWLAGATAGAPALPAGASWVRTDGLPFALDTTKLLRGSAVRYPLRVDEHGALVAADAAVATDLDVVGGARGGSTRCGEYAGGTTGRIGAGLAGGGSRLWTENGTVGCGDPVHLYCLDAHTEAIAAATVPALPQDGRNALVFVSAGRFTPGGGLTAADALCAQEAQNVPNATFVALLASGSDPPIARLGAADHRWRRLDNVIVLASHAALVAGQLDAAIDLINVPNTDFVGLGADQEVWLGAASITAPGDRSCESWTVGDTSASGQRTSASSSTGAATGETPCNQGKRIFCFQATP